MVKVRIDITIEEEILKEFDKHRNLVPRSTFINDLLEKYLKKQNAKK